VKKIDIIELILKDRSCDVQIAMAAPIFAPTNIALCKYWGKRDAELNLPMTNSLSISLPDKGASTLLESSEQNEIIVNNQSIALSSSFGKRLIEFLNLFPLRSCLRVTIDVNIPIAAGLASSACGFASLVKALNQFYAWQLSDRELSILARLGSGSACRSLWDGFVEWHQGERADGMDSHGELLKDTWPELNIEVLLVSEKEKSISSRQAMEHTIKTSAAYHQWPQKIDADLRALKQAIHEKDFTLLGETAESNALMMHAMMLTAQPPIQYSTPQTLALMQKIWNLRREGLLLYFTQDAGPNLKILFLEKDKLQVNQSINELSLNQ